MRALLVVSATVLSAAAALLACASDAATSSTGDAGTADDAGLDAKAAKDANGPGEAGATCAFNRDCQSALRCGCDEVNGCACEPGARGTGQLGVDRCDSGNDCASSVCVEGPPDSGSFCTDECATAADCAGTLPQCTDVAFVGRICVRSTPK